MWTGAIRSGKTVASLLRWLLYVRTAPLGGRLVMIGRTKDTINRNLFSVLTDRALFGDLVDEVKYTPGANVAFIFGRVVDIIGANDARAESRLRGMTCAGAYVDEATLVPHEFWMQLLGRMSVAGARLFATTNPDNPSHWLRRDYLLRDYEPAMGLRWWHFTIDDNPAISQQQIEAWKVQFVGLWYRRFILGHWVAAEGAIFDMWDEETHVVAELPLIDRWMSVGVDYGTTNPFAAILLGLGVDRALYAVSEYRYDSRQHHRSKSDEEYSAAMRAWLDTTPMPGATILDPHTGRRVPRVGVTPEWICVDPSAKSYITQLQRDGLSPASARNSVNDGIRVLASLLANHRLKVHKSCRGLIDELPGYCWDDKEREKGHDVPIKAADHSIDALRYGVYTPEALWRPYMYDLAA
ncbi:MAG: PBSX family phage terminase large subunit [Burkholderiaceae bacterium]|nr:MAG: PBSX family phage terminase large subunit [Burkholderiaceae bacterium]